MRRREASINDVRIEESERRIFGPRPERARAAAPVAVGSLAIDCQATHRRASRPISSPSLRGASSSRGIAPGFESTGWITAAGVTRAWGTRLAAATARCRCAWAPYGCRAASDTATTLITTTSQRPSIAAVRAPCEFLGEDSRPNRKRRPLVAPARPVHRAPVRSAYGHPRKALPGAGRGQSPLTAPGAYSQHGGYVTGQLPRAPDPRRRTSAQPPEEVVGRRLPLPPTARPAPRRRRHAAVALQPEGPSRSACSSPSTKWPGAALSLRT